MENLWAKAGKNWILLWFDLIFKHGFPQSNCPNCFRKSRNQQICFCTIKFIIHILSFYPFPENLPNCQKFCSWLMVVYLRTIFSKTTGFNSSIKMAIDNFFILNNFQIKNLKFHCSLRKLDWLKSKFAYSCGFSWDSNSSVSITTDWTSSVNVSVNSCISV